MLTQEPIHRYDDGVFQTATLNLKYPLTSRNPGVHVINFFSSPLMRLTWLAAWTEELNIALSLGTLLALQGTDAIAYFDSEYIINYNIGTRCPCYKLFFSSSLMRLAWQAAWTKELTVPHSLGTLLSLQDTDAVAYFDVV